MSKKTLHILMIDDHPSMIEGYKSILSFNDLGLNFKVTPAYDCESAYSIINATESEKAFDFAFVDLSLPTFLEKNIKSGEDLALLIKNKFPTCKIVILTSHAEAFILDNIQKNIEPIGILVKSDFTADEFNEYLRTFNDFSTIILSFGVFWNFIDFSASGMSRPLMNSCRASRSMPLPRVSSFNCS